MGEEIPGITVLLRDKSGYRFSILWIPGVLAWCVEVPCKFASFVDSVAVPAVLPLSHFACSMIFDAGDMAESQAQTEK